MYSTDFRRVIKGIVSRDIVLFKGYNNKWVLSVHALIH
jgi:hypothetical protein